MHERCKICYQLPDLCVCPVCGVCGRHGRKECTIEHGLRNYWVIRSPVDMTGDLAGSRFWLFNTHALFLADVTLPAPMVVIGRHAIVYMIGIGHSFGATLKFPITHAEIELAIHALREMLRLSREAESRRN